MGMMMAVSFERDGRLYGRGVADDKAGVMAHVAALRAFGDDLPVGVVVFIEGEEEYGSESLEDLLREFAAPRPVRLLGVRVAGLESAEATALVSEEYRHLLRGIQALPPRQREALVLRYYLDLSEEETARSMGIRVQS